MTPKQILLWAKAHIDEDKEYDVTPAKKKRTLTQNAYYWLLVGKLSEVLEIQNTEVHEMMLREYSTPELFMAKPEVEMHEYYEHCELWKEGVGWNTWKVYKRSRDMDTKEFTRLLKGAIQTCKDCDIETMTPEELARIRRE